MEKQKKYCNESGCGWNTDRPDARYCAQDGTRLYREPRKSNLRKRAEVVGHDLGEIAKRVGTKFGKKVGRAAFKTITYPIVGNFPEHIQYRLEKKVGRRNYNSINATNISSLTNLLTLGFPVGHCLLNHAPPGTGPETQLILEKLGEAPLIPTIIGGAGIVMAIGFLKESARALERGDYSFRLLEDRARGTVVGSIAYAPIAAGIATGKFLKDKYAGIKRYFRSVDRQARIR